MSAIRRLERIQAGSMELHIDLAGDAAYYVEGTINPHTYACLGCGLVWDRKWHAEQCEDRQHVTEWAQHYGGRTENNVYKPAQSWPRVARGRVKVG